MKLINDLFTSRKCQAFGVIAVVALWGSATGISQEQVTLIVEGGLAYILGRAIHDHAIESKGGK